MEEMGINKNEVKIKIIQQFIDNVRMRELKLAKIYGQTSIKSL